MLLELYVAVWMLMGIVGVLFYAWASVKAKIKWHPWILLILHASAIIFVVLFYPSALTITCSLIVVGLLYYFFIRCLSFCPRCGATLEFNEIRGGAIGCGGCGVVFKEGESLRKWGSRKKVHSQST